jgi:hypothetical protein
MIANKHGDVRFDIFFNELGIALINVPWESFTLPTPEIIGEVKEELSRKLVEERWSYRVGAKTNNSMVTILNEAPKAQDEVVNTQIGLFEEVIIPDQETKETLQPESIVTTGAQKDAEKQTSEPCVATEGNSVVDTPWQTGASESEEDNGSS